MLNKLHFIKIMKYVSIYRKEQNNSMKKKTKLLKNLLIDYVRFYYMGYLKNCEKQNAIIIFEILSEEDINVSDFIPVIRKMQYDLDLLETQNV
jgi:hypothetical protein